MKGLGRLAGPTETFAPIRTAALPGGLVRPGPPGHWSAGLVEQIQELL